MRDKLIIEYEIDNEDNVVILTVSRNGEEVGVFHDKQAESIYNLLIGSTEAVMLAREGRLI